VLASAEIYNTTTGTWSSTGSLATARLFHTAALLPNGEVLVAGGESGSGARLTSLERYDPTSGVWTAAGSAPSAIGYPGVSATVLASGDVLYAGGLDAGYCAAATATLFDPRTRSWEPVGNLSTGRAFASSALLPDGQALLLGGVSGGPSSCAGTAGAVRLTRTMGALPARLALALLEQGRLDLLGRSLGGSAARLSSASTSTTYPVQSSAERYDPSSRSWSAESATLPAGQVYGAATLLRDGTALTVGGRDGTLAITAALARYSY
jgi:N-acetylneuraminic acid mutarotase